jgi:hypothetical protein
VDPRSAPETIFLGQAPNQIATLQIDAWSSSTSRLAPPRPMQPIAIPPVDGDGLNQHERLSPPRPHPAQHQPQQTVRRVKAPVRTHQDGQLVAQGKHLEEQVSTRQQRESDRSDPPDDATHRA